MIFLIRKKAIFQGIICVVLNSLTLLHGQTVLSFNLDQAIEYALQNSLYLSAQQIDVHIAKKKMAQNLGAWLPEIQANIDYFYNPDLPVFVEQDGTIVRSGLNHQSAIALNIEQNLLNFEQIDAVQQAKQKKILMQYYSQRGATTLIAEIKKSFYTFLMIQQQKTALQSSIVRLEKAIADLGIRYQNGLAQKIDLDRMQILVNNAKTEYQKLLRQIVQQENWLKLQMNIELSTLVYFEGDLLYLMEQKNHLNEEILNHYESQAESSIEVKIANQALNMSQLELKNAKLQYLPRLSLLAQYQYSFFNKDFQPLWNAGVSESFVGLRLRFPVFQGFKKAYQIRISQLEVEKAKQQVTLTVQHFDYALQEIKNNLRNNLADYENQAENLLLANSNFTQINSQYQQGLRSILEVLEAQESLKKAENFYIQSIYQVLLQTISYEKLKEQIKL